MNIYVIKTILCDILFTASLSHLVRGRGLKLLLRNIKLVTSLIFNKGNPSRRSKTLPPKSYPLLRYPHWRSNW